jgi:hypothetical protein
MFNSARRTLVAVAVIVVCSGLSFSARTDSATWPHVFDPFTVPDVQFGDRPGRLGHDSLRHDQRDRSARPVLG